MHTITFECETITPMFMAGADGKTPELRAPSIKGALRFWWRALNGHLKLEELKKREGEIFGNTEQRSKVLLRVREVDFETGDKNFREKKLKPYEGHKGRDKDKWPIKVAPSHYLAYGLTDYIRGTGTVFIKKYIKPGATFSIKLKFSNQLNDVLKAEVIAAFNMLSKYGGLGAKARNGYGCFKVLAVVGLDEYQDVAVDLSNYAEKCQELPAYTAVTNFYSLFKTKKKRSWEAVFYDLADAYLYARIYLAEDLHEYSRRELIAQPIVVKKERSARENFLDRHSKPYFLHVEKISENEYQGSILCLPYNYLKGIPRKMVRRTDSLTEIDEVYNGTLLGYYKEELEAFNNLLVGSNLLSIDRRKKIN